MCPYLVINGRIFIYILAVFGFVSVSLFHCPAAEAAGDVVGSLSDFYVVAFEDFPIL